MVETLKLLHTPDAQQEANTLLPQFSTHHPGVMFQVRQQKDGSPLVLYVSPGCWELCEIEAEVIQADFSILYNLIYPQDLQTFIDSITVAVNTFTPWCWQGRIITKSGQLKWIQGMAQIVPPATDNLVWYGLFMDITTHKQVEKKLTEATAKLDLAAQRDRLLTETLARIRSSLKFEEILQITVTEVRQFLQVDRVFIGLNDGQLGVRTVAESVDPQYPSILGWCTDDKAFIKELKSLFASSRVRVVEDTTKISGSAKLKAHYQLTQTKASLAVPIILEDELLGVLIANQCSYPRQWQATEIDLLKQMSEQLAIALQHSLIYEKLATLNSSLERQVEERTAQLQQKMQELEELHRVKDVVLHTVAHDLRTSVMGNLMVLQHLLNGQKLKPEQDPLSTLISVPASILERMIQGNEYQLGMLDSLLEIHCCEKQGLILNCQLVQFPHVIDKIITNLQPLFCRNQATVENLITADLPPVMVDTNRLERVLLNLFTHSLQQNPPGLNFTLKAKVSKGMLRVQIQDHGITISKSECDRLFDLYIRDPQAPCSTSIGLKMYLCKQIIQAHGGEIGATTNQQHGLSFWFTLPLATTP